MLMSRYSQKHIALCEAAVSIHPLPDFLRLTNSFYRAVTDSTENYLFACHMINLNHLYGFFFFFFLKDRLLRVKWFVWWRGSQVLLHITGGAVQVLKTEENSTAREEMPYTFTAVWASLPKVRRIISSSSPCFNYLWFKWNVLMA